MNEKQKLIIVCGPTASGKTGLGAKIAAAVKGEVVSADSMQIYRGIPIATAQPTLEETLGVPHHLVGFHEVGKTFSLAEYMDLAHSTIAEISSRGKIPVMVGGTGLYIDSVSDDVSLSDCGSTAVRDRLSHEAEDLGVVYLYERLSAVDPASAEKIDPNNTRRIIRALEVFETTGVPFSRHNELSKQAPSRYDALRFFLNYDNRETLYDRINLRVDQMLEQGLVDEALAFREKAAESGAGQAIGHKELYPYFDGKTPLCEAVENLKQATRRYAKRQITWFSRRADAIKLLADREDTFKKAIEIIERRGFK